MDRRASDDPVDAGGDRAQILAQRPHVDVDHPAQLVMVHLRGRLKLSDAAHRIQARGIREVRSPQRNRFQVRQAADLPLGILHRQHVVVAGLGIDPKAGRDHLVRRQRGNHVVHHFALVQAQFAGSHAVHVELQSRVVDILRDEHVRDPGNGFDLRGKLQRRLIGVLLVAARHLDIDGRRQAQIQDRIHQSSRLEVCAQLRQFELHGLLYLGHIFIAAGLVVVLQAHLHEGRVHGGIGGVDGRKTGARADIGNDRRQVFGWHDAPDESLDLGDFAFRDPDPRPRGRLQIDHELSRVAAGEERKAQQREQPQTQHEEKAERQQRDGRPTQGALHQAVVRLQERFEAAVEPGVEAAAPMRRLLDETGAKQRHHGQRHNIRRKQRKNHRQGERGKQELAHPVKKGHREEDHRRGQRGRQNRKRHFPAPLLGRHFRGLAFLQVPIDVLKHDHRVVDQPRKGQRQPAQHHAVHRTAAQRQADKRSQRR